MLKERPGTSRKVSIVLGIIVGIWTAFFAFKVIDYNIRLANIRVTGNVFEDDIELIPVAEAAPLIELSTVIAILFIVMTILLLLRPRKSSAITLLIVSIFNMLPTMWVFSKVRPEEVLGNLYDVLFIGWILNASILVYSAVTGAYLFIRYLNRLR